MADEAVSSAGVPLRRSARLGGKERGSRSPVASTTASTAKTSSSVVKAREADLLARREAAALEEKIDQARREVELLEHEVKMLMDQLQEVKEREVNGPEEREARRLEVRALEFSIRTKSNDAEGKRINLKYLGKSVEREKELLEEQREVNRLLLEEDEEDRLSQDLSGEEIPSDVEDFESAFNNSRRSPSPETQEFLRRLTFPRDEEGRPPNQPAVIPLEQQLVVKPPPTSSVQVAEKLPSESQLAVAGLATALTEAIKAAGNSNNSSSEKFLARQTHGKDLPVFSGRPEEWMTFYTSFTTTTKVCEFADVDNLVRLQKCLKGDALRHVQCLMTTPDNVPVIIKELKQRFGDPKHIISALTAKVNEAPSVRDDKPDALIDLGISVKNLVSTIKALQMTNHLNNPSLLSSLENKLTFQYRMQWAAFANKTEQEPSLLEFNEWMSRMVELACKLCPPKFMSSEDKRHEARRFPQRVHAASDSTSKDKSQRKCSFCSGKGHHPTKCPSFISQNVDERWRNVRKHKLCFSCLNAGHSSTDCRSKRKCDVAGCDKWHHKELHSVGNDAQIPNVIPEENMGHATTSSHINLNILPVTLTGPKGTIKALAMLDSGATITVVNAQVAEQLGLEGPVKPLTHSGLHDAMTEVDSRSVALTITGANGKKFNLKNVRTIGNLSLPRQSVQRSTLRKWKHLNKLDVKEYGSERPSILIGQDNVGLCNTLELVRGPPNAPIAGRTQLGWVLTGRVSKGDTTDVSFYLREDNEDSLHQLVKYYFTNESFGVKPDVTKPRSREDARAIELMDKDIKRVGEAWQVGLLWKTDNPELPHDQTCALKRLHSMERKMDSDPNFAKVYEEKIASYVEKGFAVKLTPEESALVTPKTFYLPHFMAANPKKQNKLRFVFDAAAKCNGVSLNDRLLTGPDKLVPLPTVLYKFRERKIAVTADIKDMFHRVLVKPEDAAAQRFLWRGMRRELHPDVYEMRVLIFGAACSPVLAQEVKNRNALLFQEQYPATTDAIINRCYVDDVLTSVDSPAEATAIFKESRVVMGSGSFDLCRWNSNSEDFLKTVPIDLRGDTASCLGLSEDSIERVLGLFWDPKRDHFTFSLTYLRAKAAVLNGTVRPTKREVLSLTMSLFDPLGFLSLFTIRAKMILQELWRSNVGWEDEIPTTTLLKWNEWIHQLRDIPTFSLARCYSLDFSTADRSTLHIFVDASEKAYGAVTYLVIVKNGTKTTSLVSSKARVAPTKPSSIPRLELMAAVVGARLAKNICDNHSVPVTRRVFWSDSRTVLCWLNSDGRKFQPFVAHRVGEIQELTDVSEWKWIPTKENVADELTRDVDKCDWSPPSRWINGPAFLQGEEQDWPQPRQNQPVVENELELKRDYVLVMTEDPISVIDVSKFSSYSRLVNTTAYVMKYLDRCRRVKTPQNSCELQRRAEVYLQKISQAESFPETLLALKNGNPVPSDSKLRGLNVVLDVDGLLRLEGRLEKCEAASVGVKSPVILDRKHLFTKLLLSHFHNKSGHHGHERVVNEVRQLYFIPKLRTAVRATWTHCQHCKNQRAVPSTPQMGQLPSCRTETGVFPFKNTGLDYFGPIEVTVGRRHEKRWVALFTCLSTRAVHVEVAVALSTDSCIQAIRRFVGRRGCPVNIFSDNGTNFHGSNNELKRALEELNQQQLKEACAAKGMAWHFNPPAAPHMGGSWERLVRSVKIALKATLKERFPKDETFHTLLVEAEHSVNSHPLTHVSVDPDDPEALTPNHFLIGRSSNTAPVGVFGKDDLSSRKQWRQAQLLSDLFWKRWVKEYLPSLQRRTKWMQPGRTIGVGDVVLEVDPQQQRNSWPKGIVEKVFPGADGVVRVAEIKTATGRYKRPVVKLAILDVKKEEDSSPSLKFGKRIPN